ncbi:MAG: glycosyltransferase family 2 protein [Deltaproteobacteria bacterium]|nr:glycosyltransferase family 2 protein [Deltaproteobacteria bacterium]
MGPYLSIVIPAYNEETVIENTLKEVVKYLEEKSFFYEVVVVCDGCKDKTAMLAVEIAKKNNKVRVIDRKANMGKGFSVREGCLEARGDYVIFTDADLSTPIQEIEKLLKCLQEDYDIAIGSRALKESDIQIHQPWYRETMGKTFNLFVQTIAMKGIKDTQCGFKGFKKEVIRKVFPRQTINGFGFDVEVLYIAGKFGYKIKEVPIHWLNRKESKVNPLTHSLQMMTDLIRIRILDWKGAYKKSD